MRHAQQIKWGIFALALVPFGALVVRAFTGGLGANPIEAITHSTGEWGLRLLLVTLAVTPLRKLTGWNRIVQFRRMLGLFAFFYACLHVTTYLFLDQFFDWRAMFEDVIERPYITAGLSAFVLLVPLAVTSTNRWMRRLGRNWSRLHRLVYPAAIIAVIHFLWLVKADSLEPGIYAIVLALLLGARLIPDGWRRKRRKHRGVSAAQIGVGDERLGVARGRS